MSRDIFEKARRFLRRKWRTLRTGSSWDEEEYKESLRQMGMKIGQHTKIFSQTVSIDAQRPWMVEIGDYCKIAKGVIILQHDYSRSVLRRVYGEVIGTSQKTVIGDNVFIGMNSIILMGANIGNNVIVGAGSVVRGTIPDNVVVAGQPARVICTLEQHYHSLKNRCITEAAQTYLEYRRTYGERPTVAQMGSFWPLFLQHDAALLQKYNVLTALSGDDEEDIVRCWLNSDPPPFESYEAFCQYCENDFQNTYAV